MYDITQVRSKRIKCYLIHYNQTIIDIIFYTLRN